MLGGSLWHRGHRTSSNSRERRARAQKKTAPKGGLWIFGKLRGQLEVNSAARIEEIEIVQRYRHPFLVNVNQP
jgi:hypothetical protein